jgi:hypothetical protein
VPVLPAGKVDDVVILVELAHQLHAAAVVHPRVLLAIVRPERNRATERERRVLAEEVVRRRVRALYGAVLDGVDDAERRDDFTAANTWIWNLLSVAAATRLLIVSAAPKIVSRLFGKLDASRHFTSGPTARIPARKKPPGCRPGRCA